MSLKDRITEDMKTAMRAREAERLSAIRLLLAAVKQREVDDRVQADDALVTAVVERLIKQRRDSVAQFEQAGRQDLADRERAGGVVDVVVDARLVEQGGDRGATAVVEVRIEQALRRR